MWIRSLLPAAAVALAIGCAEPVEDINRVQPHYLSKSVFQGEWYYRQTIVEVSPEISISFAGDEAALEKIRWEIEEDQLVAYRVHEPIVGLDDDDGRPGGDFKGDPVAYFTITKHFDIRRRYNASTGEETNEIVENSSDRPWYEREYIRVNWASGRSEGPVDFHFVQLIADLTGSTDYVRETEVFDPDHLIVTDDYIQMTRRQIISDNGFTCFYVYGNYNCGAGEAKIRYSFAKIDPEDEAQYEPRSYEDNLPVRDDQGRILRSIRLNVGRGNDRAPAELACTPELLDYLNELTAPGYFSIDDCREVRFPVFEKFGLFRTERYVYDRRVGGAHDNHRQMYANVHNIWHAPLAEEPFEDTAEGGREGEYDAAEPWQDLNGNRLFDRGEPFEDLNGNGRWDDGDAFVDYNENGLRDATRVPRPLSQRRPKPVVYYANSGFPEDLEHVLGQMSNDWDEAFIAAAAARLGPEAAAQETRFCGYAQQRRIHACLAGVEPGDADGESGCLAGEIERVATFCRSPRDKAGRDACGSVSEELARPADELARELGRSARARLLKVPCTVAGQAVSRSTDEVRRMLREDFATAQAKAGDTDWMFFTGDGLREGGMFQIRRNTCSPEGVAAYLKRNPDLEDVVGEATAGDGVLPGNIQRVCSGLHHFSRARGLEPFEWQQIGDLRYSFVNWVHEPQPSGPLGYGPSSADPENGRILAGSAHVYGAGVDTYARGAADIVRAMNEDLDIDALISGYSYEQWLGQSTLSVADMPLKVDEALIADVRARIGDFKVEGAYGDYKLPDGSIDKAALQRQMVQRARNPHPQDPMADAFRAPVDLGRQRLEKLKQDPVFRSRFLTDEHLALVAPLYGWKRGQPISDEMEQAAVDLAVDVHGFNEGQRARFEYFEKRNVYMADFLDDSVIGLALEMKGLEPEEVYKRLRESIFRAVMLHEIGHTVGLTHNFAASFDALNYHDDFWDIRHRYEPGEWNGQRLAEFQYSSIMDYHSRFNTDFAGLGKYDIAAVKFAYGNHMEVFPENQKVSASLSFDVFIDGYEKIPELVDQVDGDYQKIARRVDVPAEELMRRRREGIMANSRLFRDNLNALKTEYWVDHEVPYNYCIYGNFRGGLGCLVYDEGARHTDGVRSAIRNYWNYFVFNSYRRGRSERDFINGYFARQDRLAEYLRYPFRYFYFYEQYDIGLRNDLLEAALVGLNFINQVLGTPEPGRHCLDAERNVYVPFYQLADGTEAADCETLDVPVGTGRDYLLRLNDEHEYKIDYIGSYYDKINFLYYLADTSTSFFQVANLGNSRAFSIGYYRTYRAELIKLMRDMLFHWLGDEEGDAFSPLVSTEGAADNRVRPRALVNAEAFGQTPDQTAGMSRLRTPISYNMVWQGLVLNTVFNTSTYDSEVDFAEYLAISEVGSGDDRDLPEGWGVATFVHPRTRVTYKAAQTRDGNSLSYELLTRAQDYARRVWQPAFDALQEKPRNEALRARFDAVDRKLEQYVDVMSDLRLLRAAVDWSND